MEGTRGAGYVLLFQPLTASPSYLPKDKELQETFHPPIHSGIKLEGTSEKSEKPSPFFYQALAYIYFMRGDGSFGSQVGP